MPKPKLFRLIGFAAVAAIIFTACTPETSAPAPSPAPTPAPEPENPAVISDRTGRQWDVTHARDVYGMDPNYFNYGLGVGAIPSVDEPTVLSEGDPGYPDPDRSTQVFGVNRNGEQRAYNVRDLAQHEVFNDIFPGDSYLAVTF